jgi:hypothetical protein
VLHRQVDLIAQSLASNLDAVSESRKSTVRPTASTILWNVLIETVREVAHAVNVAPAKGVRQILRLDILIRQRGSVGISDLVSLENLKKHHNAWHGMAWHGMFRGVCVCERESIANEATHRLWTVSIIPSSRTWLAGTRSFLSCLPETRWASAPR